MLVNILRRLVTVIPTLIGVIIVTFLLTRVLPGDPAVYFAGPAATPQSIADIRKSLGLDKPLPEQFLRYVDDLAHGNLGNSLATGRPVVTEIVSRLPASAELTLFGLIIAIAIAIPLGILAAVKQGSWIDHTCRIVATAGVSLPVFFTGLLLVYVFYFRLGWAPAPLGRLDTFATAPNFHTGFYLIDSLIDGDLQTFRASLAQILLPAFSMAIFSLAPIARVTRASMLAALGSDFVRREGQRAVAPPHRLHLCVPQRGTPRHHDDGHGVLVSARRQRPDRKGFCLAGDRLLRDRGIDRLRLCAGSGLRPDNGVSLCAAQPGDRRDLWRCRPTRTDRGMTEALRHARYVLSENPVMSFAFGLFSFFVLCAIFGSVIAPYDPLASDTAQALRPPSLAHLFGTDQLGRDIFSRVVIATRLDFGIAVTSVALAFGIGTLMGLCAGYFGGWTDRIIGRIVDTIMAFPIFILAMGIVAARQLQLPHRNRRAPPCWWQLFSTF